MTMYTKSEICAGIFMEKDCAMRSSESPRVAAKPQLFPKSINASTRCARRSPYWRK